ncbi:hypothetical protein BGM09_30715 [Streptomyces sp. CBMA29]|nr:hypothetical protein [Streptomyces sp. CBMA29]
MWGTRRQAPSKTGAETPRRWKFLWVALFGLLLAVAGGFSEAAGHSDLGVELTVLRDDGHGHCTVRWTDPLDGRVREAPFACDSDRPPILRDWEYGWEVTYWPWRGDLRNSAGVGSSASDVTTGLTLAGLFLLLVASVGGAVRIVRRRRAGAEARDARRVPMSPPRGTMRSRPVATAVLALTGGVIALVGGGCLLGIAVPHARHRERDFRAAVPCPADLAAMNRSAAQCLRTESFTVGKVRIRSGKNSYYTADLAGPESSATRRVRFAGKSPLLRRLESGDTVRGVLWRDGIVTVTSADGETRQDTKDNPTGSASNALVGGVVVTVGGAVLTGVGGALTVIAWRAAYRRRVPRG